MPRIIVYTLIALFYAPAAFAQTATPEEVALDLSAAFKDFDLERAAEIFHPEELKRLQDIMVDIVTMDSSGVFSALVTGESDPEAIKALTPQEAFIRFLGGLVKLQPDIADAFASLETEALGHVKEGEDMAHVVTRSHASMMDFEVTQMEVVTLKMYNGEWRALLTGDLNSLAQALRSNLGSP